MLVNMFFRVHPLKNTFTGASAAEAPAVSKALSIAVWFRYSKGSRLPLMKESKGLIAFNTQNQLKLSQDHVCFSLEMNKTGTASFQVSEYRGGVTKD